MRRCAVRAARWKLPVPHYGRAVPSSRPSTWLAGVGLALLNAASFGVMPVLTKVVYEDGADAVGVLAVRFSLAGLVLFAVAVLRGETLPRGRTLGALVLLGGVGYVVESLCYFLALERISAGLTALLLYFYPALVVLLAAVVLRVRPRPLALLCVAVATGGTALTIGPVGGGETLGIALGLTAAAAYALYIVLSGTVLAGGRVGPFATAAVVMTSCAVVYDVLAVGTGARLPGQATAWLALVGVALIGTVVAVAAFFAALARLGPSDTAVVSTVEPVVSIAVAALVLGERLGPIQVAGGVLVLTAVAVLARLEPATRKTQEEVPA
jgi:drug/metabolite transporter (DMT)-like permease